MSVFVSWVVTLKSCGRIVFWLCRRFTVCALRELVFIGQLFCLAYWRREQLQIVPLRSYRLGAQGESAGKKARVLLPWRESLPPVVCVQQIGPQQSVTPQQGKLRELFLLTSTYFIDLPVDALGLAVSSWQDESEVAVGSCVHVMQVALFCPSAGYAC